MQQTMSGSGPYCPYCQSAKREAANNPRFDIGEHAERCNRAVEEYVMLRDQGFSITEAKRRSGFQMEVANA